MNQETINQIRNKIDIVDLIGEYIPLSQKGKNFFGVCPFHDDTNPSMSVSREKQIYKCFSCGASGNVFTFVSEYEHISFPEALELLAKKAGYALGQTVVKKNSNYDEFYEIYDLALKFYQNNINTSSGKEAKAYLKNRSIEEKDIKNFSIGLSLDRKDALIQLLRQKGYAMKTIVDLGLATDDHDVYLQRIMFPLHDTNGHVVGFSGRIYGDSKLNKYLNTKETVIFKKGQCLYNYHIAKEAARKMGYVIVMEGFMDVIRASIHGFLNTVALMGTALTKEQTILLKKLSLNIILCFDGDEAGAHATKSIGLQLEKIGIHPKVITMEHNDDPDTYILKYGREKFASLIENAVNFEDYKITTLKKGVNFNSDLELSTYIDQVLRETAKVSDEIRREIILKKLAIEVNIGYNTLEKRLNEYRGKTEKKQPIKGVSSAKLSRYDKAVYALLYSMMNSEDAILAAKKTKVYFSVALFRHLYNEILFYYEQNGTINLADMYTYLTDKKELLVLVQEIMKADDYDYSNKAIEDYIRVIQKYNMGQEVNRLNELMKKEVDPMEKSKIADEIRLIKIGENCHG